MFRLSIIIPIFNEAGNIASLTTRIHQTFVNNPNSYEIIFIDDHSEDDSLKEIAKLALFYPIQVYQKQGRKGKAQSLIEGFSYARGDLIAMIDGDLQYPPEALPEMMAKIEQGFDIVVANRIESQTSLIRKFVSKSFNKLFVNFLHNLDCDTQSGLKLFKKEIVERVELNPSPWAFDLEFLLKVLNAGYTLTTIDVPFFERTYGKSKVGLLTASTQIGSSALKLKFSGVKPVPFSRAMAQSQGLGFHHKGQKFIHHSNLQHEETAFFRLNGGQVWIGILFVILLLSALALNWKATIVGVLGLLSILYLIDLIYNFFLIFRSFAKKPELSISDEELTSLIESELPRYTILCPLYKEWQVLPQFVDAINKLDYPKEKLEVLLLLEENDAETIAQARAFDLPQFYQIMVVPDSSPKTKPKACNFGLQFVTGQYCVIYDAEDIPEPSQLKKAIVAFHKASSFTACVQAKLNFYNPHQNILTRVFTAEYSLWFDLVLTGLQSINAPIPLGGTSNHFKTNILKYLKGWDAFNVTEDCDLGVRLFKKGFTTAMMDSTTYEEANSNLKNWFGQRSRWIKGYIQSYFVHMRYPKELFVDGKRSHFLSFQLLIGGKIFCMLVNPLMWLTTILYFAFRPTLGHSIESFFPPLIFYPAVFAAVVGNFLYLYYYMIGCAKRGYYDLIKYVYLVPFYWLFMSVASWYAVYKIIIEPHYWYKTKHGLHLNTNRLVNLNFKVSAIGS